jgi:HAE1 family hydrophobic/amphiphilic exporter-1
MRLTDISVKRPVTTTVVFLALIVVGVFSLGRLALDLIPDITFPVIGIYAPFAGAAPEEVEENLTKLLENQAASASNVEKLSSTSSEGSSFVMVEFTWGTDLDAAANDLRERLDVIRDVIPEGASQPMLFKFDPSMMPIMVLTVEGQRGLESLRYISENTIKTALEQVEGVASVYVEGGFEKQIGVDIDRSLLASYGLTIDQVVNVLRAENQNITGGSVDEGSTKYSLRTIGKLTSLEDIRRVVVGSAQGRPVYLGDVARVESGFADNELDVMINRNDAVIVVVQKQSGTNTVLISDKVKEKLAALELSLPEDMNIIELFASSNFINKAIANVWRVALLGGILALIILFVFLRNLPTTLIVAVSIPLSIIVTVVAMYFFDLTLNMLSLGGLALGIGMLVDNSIVIIENIFRYRESGSKPNEAARHGSQEMANAIVASTLTTVAVFLPLVLFIRGLAKELFKDLAFTVTFSLLGSLIVALTLIPMLSSRIRQVAIKKRANTLLNVEEELAARGKTLRLLDRVYHAVLEWVLRRKIVVWLGVLVIFGGSLALIPLVGIELFPESDSGELNISIEAPVGTNLDTTRVAVNEIFEIVEREVPEADTNLVQIGTSGGMMSLPASNTGSLMLHLVDLNERQRSDQDIIAALRPLFAEIPGAEVRFSRGFGPGGGGGGMQSGLTIQVLGYDLKQGKELAERIRAVMDDVEIVKDVEVSREEGLPEYRVMIDRDRAAQYGLTVGQVGTTIRRAYAGENVANVLFEGDEVGVLVRFREEDRSLYRDIDRISVSTPMGISVPLANMVSVERDYGPVQIQRENQQRVITLNARVEGDVRSAVNQIKAGVNQIAMPQGFSVIYGGSWEDIQAVVKDLVLVLLLSIILIYFIMAAQFESFVDPFIIMFTLPMTFIGVIWIHLLSGTIFSAFSGIGLLMLVGIVVNNGIILVDYTNLLRRRGYELVRAVVAAGRLRLRPILMTMLTTVLGLTPMTLLSGSGSELRKPMALTVIGGLLVSTLFTLVLIPVVYATFESRRAKRRLKKERQNG